MLHSCRCVDNFPALITLPLFCEWYYYMSYCYGSTISERSGGNISKVLRWQHQLLYMSSFFYVALSIFSRVSRVGICCHEAPNNWLNVILAWKMQLITLWNILSNNYCTLKNSFAMWILHTLITAVAMYSQHVDLVWTILTTQDGV